MSFLKVDSASLRDRTWKCPPLSSILSKQSIEGTNRNTDLKEEMRYRSSFSSAMEKCCETPLFVAACLKCGETVYVFPKYTPNYLPFAQPQVANLRSRHFTIASPMFAFIGCLGHIPCSSCAHCSWATSGLDSEPACYIFTDGFMKTTSVEPGQPTFQEPNTSRTVTLRHLNRSSTTKCQYAKYQFTFGILHPTRGPGLSNKGQICLLQRSTPFWVLIFG